MLSGLLLINQKGDVIISRSYRDDISRTAADAFRQQVIASKESAAPVACIGNCSFCYVKHENIYFVGVSRLNSNAAMIFSYLHQLINVLKYYFNNTLDEEHIRQNFVLIYELMDETMDYGYPQHTEIEVLTMYVTQGGMKDKLSMNKEAAQNVTIKATGQTPWRAEGLKYKKNEVFIDVVESVNLLMSANGNILSQAVSGEVQIKAYLSGMPECRFGMNDKLGIDKERKEGKKQRSDKPLVELDDISFHQCVKLGKFDHDRTTTFIPPNGEFTLMRYRLTGDSIKLPFKVHPKVEEVGRNRVQIKVVVKAVYDAKNIGTNVVMKVPTPKNTANVSVSCGLGKAKYDPTESAIMWRIKKFQGGSETTLDAEVNLLASMQHNSKPWTRPPITMDFQVPMTTASGLTVRYLKVIEKSQYETTKWVRYVTKAGTYENRI